MFSHYLQAALNHAAYEILPDGEGFYGRVPPCPGVCAMAETLEACRTALIEALEGWILLRVHLNLPLPTIDEVQLVVEKVA